MLYHKQTAQFIATVAQNMPEISGEVMQEWIENPKGLQRFLEGLCSPVKREVSFLAFDWREAYNLLGILVEYDSEIASLAISEQDGLWIIPVIKGVTCNSVVACLERKGVKVWTYKKDLDKDIISDRDPNRDGSYIVSFHSNVEADEENKNQSAKQRREQGYKDITLLECLLLELAYFLATGKHLNISNWTLCSGSCGHGGRVPSVAWRIGALKVDRYYSDDQADYLCPRSVVFCQPKPERA